MYVSRIVPYPSSLSWLVHLRFVVQFLVSARVSKRLIHFRILWLLYSIRLHYISIFHFRILTSGNFVLLSLLGLFRILFGLLPRFKLCPLLCSLFFLCFEDSLPFFFDFVLIPADDRAGNEANLVHFGHVNTTGSVFAFVVEPVLCFC